jgi:hypothetical protein
MDSNPISVNIVEKDKLDKYLDIVKNLCDEIVSNLEKLISETDISQCQVYRSSVEENNKQSD